MEWLERKIGENLLPVIGGHSYSEQRTNSALHLQSIFHMTKYITAFHGNVIKQVVA